MITQRFSAGPYNLFKMLMTAEAAGCETVRVPAQLLKPNAASKQGTL